MRAGFGHARKRLARLRLKGARLVVLARGHEVIAQRKQRPCRLQVQFCVLWRERQGPVESFQRQIRLARTQERAALKRQRAKAFRLGHREDSVMERYATVLLTGRFGAAYLQIGLGRTAS